MQVPVVELIGTQHGPRGLIIAGVHGDEWDPFLAAIRLQALVRPEHLKGCLTIVPAANQSAIQMGSRAGTDGLDLARTMPGAPDGSPTEVLAHEIANLIYGSDFLVDLHTGGLAMRIFPMTGYMLHPKRSVLETQRSMAHAMNLPFIWGTSPDLEGRTISVARDAGIPAIYAEWGGGLPDRHGVHSFVEGVLNILSFFGMIEHRQFESRIGCVFEDPSAGSGRLLTTHPAPMAGVFDAVVEVGQNVRCGDVLGVLFGFDGINKVSVTAEQSGLVLCLRGLPVVSTGDSLAMVVEVQTADT